VRPALSGSSAGGVGREPSKPRLFDEKAARAALDRELQNAKAACKAPSGVDAQSGVIKATFQPNGMMAGINVLRSDVNRDANAGVNRSLDQQADCIKDMISFMMGIQVSIPPFDGPPVPIVHPFKF
jgi:hypothetical protein